MAKLFPTQEIGSFAKPAWLTHLTKDTRPSEDTIRDALTWGKVFGIPAKDIKVLQTLLRSKDSFAQRERVRDFASLYLVQLQESAGLDYVYNGEAKRIEMYEYPVRLIDGFEFLGHVRSFDNKYYRKGACKGKVELKEPYHTREFLEVRSIVKKKVKVPITGAYTLADWSFNEFYLSKRIGKASPKRAKAEAKREFTLDIAEKVIRPNLLSLANAGADYIQIDEPAAATHPDEVDLFVEATNVSTKGVGAKLGMHICFSEYASLFPSILEMRDCSIFTWEFANRDDDKRSGYRVLKLFKDYNDEREIGLGVLNVHVDDIESPELVRDRVLYAARLLGPEKIYVNPDCGLRTRTWEVAYAKLKNMVKGASLARKELEG
jgi:5-methyltetrahydropteroyltriglutamate--homocysteine methyltransferase